MATPNAYQVQLTATLLEDSTTVLSSPGVQETGTVTEAFGGLPQKIAGSASDTVFSLGGITDPIFLGVWGDEGVSFKIASDGDALNAYPFACLSDEQDGLGISQIWVSNSEADEKTFTILAIE